MLSNCSEDAPTKPEEKKDDAIATKTIDANGGTFETEEFKLDVPPGAFKDGVELKLYIVADNTTDDNSVTKTYQLEGLPDEFTKSLKVGIKYIGTLKNESFVRVEQKYLFEETGDTLSTFNFISATDSSGFMWTHLPLRTDTYLAKTNNRKMIDPLDIFTLGGWTDFLSNKSAHFKISLPSKKSHKNYELLNILETNYNKVVNDVNLSFNDKWWEWPIKVLVIDREINPYSNYIVWTSLSRNNSVNVHRLFFEQLSVSHGNLQKIKIASGKDLVNLALSIPFEKKGNSWVRRAIYTWSEELFTEDQNFISPEKFQPNSIFPFEIGMAQKEGTQLNLNHGDGMSSMIKYLVDDESKFGKEGLKKTLESIQNGANPVTALINNVNALKAEWLTDYYRKYVGGKIYNVPANTFIDFQSLTGSWDIKNDADTLMEFKPTSAGVGKMPDLSAQLFLVNLKYPEIDPSKSLTFGVEGDVNSDGFSTIIFGYKNEKLVHLVQGYASESILEIPNLKNSGYTQFLVVVVNSNGVPPYSGESNAYLTLKVEGENNGSDGILASNICSAKIVINGHFQHGDGSTLDAKKNITGDAFSIKGSFSGNTFVGNINFTDPNFNDTYEGTMTVTLNEAHTLATNFSWENNSTKGNGDFTNFNVSATIIPVGDPTIYGSDAYRIFRVSGLQTCNSLSLVEYKDYGRWFSDTETTLLNYTCDQESYIHISFRQE